MGTFSIWHWIVVLLVIVLLFGTKKLRNAGGDLGAAIRSFKKGLNEGQEDAPGKLEQSPPSEKSSEAQKTRSQ